MRVTLDINDELYAQALRLAGQDLPPDDQHHWRGSNWHMQHGSSGPRQQLDRHHLRGRAKHNHQRCLCKLHTDCAHCGQQLDRNPLPCGDPSGVGYCFGLHCVWRNLAQWLHHHHLSGGIDHHQCACSDLRGRNTHGGQPICPNHLQPPGANYQRCRWHMHTECRQCGQRLGHHKLPNQ